MKFTEQKENVPSNRKMHKSLASIINLSSVPYYDHITHWEVSDIPNLVNQGVPEFSY